MSADTALRPPPAATPANGALVGSARLTRFALRRDRMRLLGWGVGIGGLTAYYCAVVPGIYPDPAARQGRAALMRGPAAALLTGPGYGVDDYRLGR